MTNFASPKANNKQQRTKSQITKQNQTSPLPHISTSQTSTTQNQLPKAISPQTPRSIQQTYRRDAVLPNEKDGPNMTTAQCNRRRRWSYLQCVRDGERTKDHEKTPRHTNKRTKSKTIFHMCVNARNHHACRRWCAAHHHDKLRIAQSKQQTTKNKITMKTKAPSLISTS